MGRARRSVGGVFDKVLIRRWYGFQGDSCFEAFVCISKRAKKPAMIFVFVFDISASVIMAAKYPASLGGIDVATTVIKSCDH